ncbi:MAG: cysteine--tRNA ligase, partial [Pseudomonadota bacterium]|nr:cysteine--tRNA ligase [Pseudomonadota bacterium]
VTYVRNFTDVDDKINARAAESGRAIGDITAETTQWYLDDMGALGAMEPNHMPRATQYIGEMITMIEKLIADGFAYAHEGHVLFRVRKYDDYGKLSGRSVDDMIAGARVEVASYKEDPMDFVLWKPSDESIPGWDSPWGRGRPGWHIECSAMSYELLGAHFDIHGGGNDLMFPHHENEIAQSCCANGGQHMANYWLHNEMLQVEGKKMSKSLGNFFTVRDLLDGHDGHPGVPGEVIRFVFLSTHYGKPMDWTAKKAAEAEKKLRKIAQFLAADPQSKPWEMVGSTRPPQEFIDALANDLNTSLALTLIGKYLKEMREADLVSSLQLLGFEPGLLIEKFAGTHASTQDNGIATGTLSMPYSGSPDLAQFSALLFKVRKEAMQTKDFSEVDRIKSVLTDAGVEVRMSKDGVELLPTTGFDASKLEGLL